MTAGQLRTALRPLSDDAPVEFVCDGAPFDDESVEYVGLTTGPRWALIHVIVVDDFDREMRAWDAASGQEVVPPNSERVRSLPQAPEGGEDAEPSRQ